MKMARVVDTDGGAWLGEVDSFARVSEDPDADSKGDRSVGVASSEDMLLSLRANNYIERDSRRRQIVGAVVRHGWIVMLKIWHSSRCLEMQSSFPAGTLVQIKHALQLFVGSLVLIL